MDGPPRGNDHKTTPLADDNRAPEWTLAGVLTAFSPSALLSLLNMQKATGDLRLVNYDIVAQIFVEAGEVVEATLGRDRGLPALFYALSWTNGRF